MDFSLILCGDENFYRTAIKQNAVACRGGGEGSYRSAKGRSAKMRLRVASHLLPPEDMLCTSLVVLRPDCLLAVRRRKSGA